MEQQVPQTPQTLGQFYKKQVRMQHQILLREKKLQIKFKASLSNQKKGELEQVRKEELELEVHLISQQKARERL